MIVRVLIINISAMGDKEINDTRGPGRVQRCEVIIVGEVRVVVESEHGEVREESMREARVAVQCQFCPKRVQIPGGILKGRSGRTARDNLLRHMGQHYPEVEELEV